MESRPPAVPDGTPQRAFPTDRLDPARLAAVLLRRRTRAVLAWVAALVTAGIALGYAWTFCNDPARADGNWGHANVDFAGQWVLGRLLLEGRRLYDRGHLRAALEH